MVICCGSDVSEPAKESTKPWINSMSERVFVITGSSTGIGVGIAASLVKSGTKRMVLVARRKDKLQEVAKDLEALGATAVLTLSKDLANLEAAAEIVKETVNEFGRLDVLVNNVGIMDIAPAVDTSDEMAQRVFNVNFFASVAMTREALPHIRKVKGSVVFISSIVSMHPFPTMGIYCASKAAVTSFAKVTALEEAPNGVRVNIVSPGLIQTDMSRPFLDGKTGAEADDKLKQFQPLPSGGRPEDIGQAVAFLSGQESAPFITGTDLVVDGGKIMNPFMGLPM